MQLWERDSYTNCRALSHSDNDDHILFEVIIQGGYEVHVCDVRGKRDKIMFEKEYLGETLYVSKIPEIFLHSFMY